MKLHVFLVVVVASLLLDHVVQSSNKNNFLRQQRSLDEEEIDCKYIRGDMRFEDGTSEGFDACEDGNTLYDLPQGMLAGVNRLNDLHSGKTRLAIKGAKEVSTVDITETDHIEVTTGTQPLVSLYEPKEDDGGNERGLTSVTSNEIVTTMGRKTIIIVRVTSLDSNVTYTKEELSKGAFGSGVPSFATQMERCSNGKLVFQPAHGTDIHGGVGELFLNDNTNGVGTKNLQTALREGFVRKFGDEDQYDFIAYCMPPGTGQDGRSWVAYAYRDTKFSYYNDVWCGSLTSKMHEIGHCIGLGHSGEYHEEQDTFQSYEDRSCAMGVSFRRTDGPQECFNGWRHWALGWFADRQTTVDPVLTGSWGGHLAAFVDYAEGIHESDYAIVNVRDVYVQYNLKDKHNWEVGERPNQVTIVKQQGDAESPSLLLAGIDMLNPTFQYEHNGNSFIFEYCDNGIKPGLNGGDVRFIKISIHEEGKSSACGVVEAETTASPTPEPTVPPTPEPTPKPTVQPTPKPTAHPTPMATAQAMPTEEKKRQKRNYNKRPPQQQGHTPKDEKKESPGDESDCADSTLPFTISGKEVTCDKVARDSSLKSIFCTKGSVAYSECRKTCDSCGHTKKSSSTTLGSSTLVRRPPSLWDLSHDGGLSV